MPTTINRKNYDAWCEEEENAEVLRTMEEAKVRFGFVGRGKGVDLYDPDGYSRATFHTVEELDAFFWGWTRARSNPEDYFPPEH